METFRGVKDFVRNPHFKQQRQKSLRQMDISTIDEPIADIVKAFAKLPYCFTLQSCFGHFLYDNQRDSRNTERLPLTDSIQSIEYRIAYIALCIQDNEQGRELYEDLSVIVEIDPEYIQLGCAEWFWERQVNSYALQVEPEKHMTEDRATVNYKEALHIEEVRDRFFAEIRELLRRRLPAIA